MEKTYEEIKNDLFTGDYGDQLCDYSGSTYICDAITEIADGNTSIYYSDIEKFMSKNIDAVNDAISEFGWDGCGCDLYKAGQMAEFSTIERDIYDNLADAIQLWAIDYIRSEYGESIDAEKWEEIAGELDGIDNNNRFDDIVDIINEIMEPGEEEDGEAITDAAANIIDAVADIITPVPVPAIA